MQFQQESVDCISHNPQHVFEVCSSHSRVKLEHLLDLADSVKVKLLLTGQYLIQLGLYRFNLALLASSSAVSAATSSSAVSSSKRRFTFSATWPGGSSSAALTDKVDVPTSSALSSCMVSPAMSAEAAWETLDSLGFVAFRPTVLECRAACCAFHQQNAARKHESLQ